MIGHTANAKDKAGDKRAKNVAIESTEEDSGDIVQPTDGAFARLRSILLCFSIISTVYLCV